MVPLLISMAATAGSLEITVRDQRGRPVADAVVFIVEPAAASTNAPSVGMIDQVDKHFVPRISAISVGTAVSFPNKDDIKHHVYSFSPAKTFELKLYHGIAAEPVLFDKPGLVTLGCNIHDGMIAYLYVVPGTHFGLTASDGTVTLAAPTAETTVSTWHHQMTMQTASPGSSVSVTAQTPSVELTLNLRDEVNLPPPLE